MDELPNLYLFDERGGKFLLLMSEFSAEQGMSVLSRDLEIEEISLGTPYYENFDWATEGDFPPFKTSGELLDFLRSEEIIFLTFELKFKNFGSLRTHDDGECNFELIKKSDVLELVRRTSPNDLSELILSTLLSEQGKYVFVAPDQELKVYDTFDSFLKANPN